MKYDEITEQKHLSNIYGGARNIVILGAGASIACVSNTPEKNGKKLPAMNNLPSVIGLKDVISKLPKKYQVNNFEVMYSRLNESGRYADLLIEIESKIYNYFDDLELPNIPTIYDYLVLSLRKKDLIATFNWDPFLWQAIQRNLRFTKNLPRVVFLHGNVAIGVSEEKMEYGSKRFPNGTIDIDYHPSKLLFPVESKNYEQDPFINSQWNILRKMLGSSPLRICIFGYSAPDSDKAAIKLMQEAYGAADNNPFAQIEIIDIKSEQALLNSWKAFILRDHHTILNDFFDSWIMEFPRRSGEAHHDAYLECKAHPQDNPPKFSSLPQMWDWYSKFLPYEKDEQ